MQVLHIVIGCAMTMLIEAKEPSKYLDDCVDLVKKYGRRYLVVYEGDHMPFKIDIPYYGVIATKDALEEYLDRTANYGGLN